MFSLFLVGTNWQQVSYAASGGMWRCQKELVADGFIAIDIHDRGPGFPENTGEVTVNPFWCGDTSRSRATEETGLNLSVAQAIAVAHGGKLELSDRSGALRFLFSSSRNLRNAIFE